MVFLALPVLGRAAGPVEPVGLVEDVERLAQPHSVTFPASAHNRVEEDPVEDGPDGFAAAAVYRSWLVE